MNEILEHSNVIFDSICGVPYTALPIASVSQTIERNELLMILFVFKRLSVQIINDLC
jgi:hypothetical protein